MSRVVHHALICGLCALTVSSLGVGCGAGGAAKAVRPEMPKAGDAMGQGSCDPTPYIVDLDPRELADLERKFSQGIVVVKRDCQSPMKILADCSVRGSYAGVYAYAGTSAFESLQSLRDADEIKAHLATGPALAASLDTDVKRGTTIDIAFQQIGTANTSKIIGKDDLVPARPGGCDGASHFVGTFYLGAFLTKASTAAEANATAEIFKQGGSAKSASSAFQEHHLGKASVCTGVDQKDNTQPVNDCRAPVSVKLVAIEEGSPAKVVDSGRPPPPPSFRPFGTTTKSCFGTSATQCATVCSSANDAPSCASAGFLYEEGRGGLAAPNVPQAFDFYKKGCDGGSADACAGLGILYSKGDAPGGKNAAEADRLLVPACLRGSGRGCSGVGTKALFEEKNADKAIEFLVRGCRLGYPRACFYAASEMNGVGRDPKSAFLMAKRACDALDVRGCLLSSLFAEQDDAAGVRQRALAALGRGCDAKNGEDCRALGKWYRGDYDAKQADASQAKGYFARACQYNDKLCNEPAAAARTTPGPATPAGFAVQNDSPWPICAVEAGTIQGTRAVFARQNFLAKRLEKGASAPFASVPDSPGVLRITTCDKKSMAVTAFVPGRPATYVMQAIGGRAAGANVVTLTPAATYAKTPYALR
jgi:TPR repeat protein